MAQSALKVLVLAGGPDRERPVSLVSGAAVAKALREAGHEILERDIGPDRLEALDEFTAWGGQVIFPVLHGSWGEGGALQRILDQRGLRYVGCTAEAAALCMDKGRTKELLLKRSLPTPAFEVLSPGQDSRLAPPLVVKALCEGSSIDLVICRDAAAVRNARQRLQDRHASLLLEQFVRGKELTVGVIGCPNSSAGDQALPPIQIVPATEFYDYQAKYERNDTQYLFDIDLPPQVLASAQRIALATHQALGCRHLSRVDIIVDQRHQPWILEVNTIPGFTDHSLLPKAAAKAGIPLPKLVDRLVRLAMDF